MQEKNQWVSRHSELEKQLTEKSLENDYVLKEFQHEKNKNKQYEIEIERLKSNLFLDFGFVLNNFFRDSARKTKYSNLLNKYFKS